MNWIEKYQNRKIQSISLEVADQNQRIELADQITKNGGDRCPRMGMMSLYSSPWDGMFAIDRLVRWIPLDVNWVKNKFIAMIRKVWNFIMLE